MHLMHTLLNKGGFFKEFLMGCKENLKRDKNTIPFIKGKKTPWCECKTLNKDPLLWHRSEALLPEASAATYR